MNHNLTSEPYELENILGKDELSELLPHLWAKCKKVQVEDAYYLFQEDYQHPKDNKGYDLEEWYSKKGAMIVLKRLGFINNPMSQFYHGPFIDQTNEGECTRECPITGVVLRTYLYDYGVEQILEYFDTYIAKEEKISSIDWYYIHQVAEQLNNNAEQWDAFGAEFMKFVFILQKRKKL